MIEIETVLPLRVKCVPLPNDASAAPRTKEQHVGLVVCPSGQFTRPVWRFARE